MLNKLIMNLIKSFLNDIQDLYHGCDKGDVDNNEFYKCFNSLLHNGLETLEMIKNNPYIGNSDDSIEEDLFELKQWMVEDWLNNHDTDDDQYLKYCQLNDALTIIEEKGK